MLSVPSVDGVTSPSPPMLTFYTRTRQKVLHRTTTQPIASPRRVPSRSHRPPPCSSSERPATHQLGVPPCTSSAHSMHAAWAAYLAVEVRSAARTVAAHRARPRSDRAVSRRATCMLRVPRAAGAARRSMPRPAGSASTARPFAGASDRQASTCNRSSDQQPARRGERRGGRRTSARSRLSAAALSLSTKSGWYISRNVAAPSLNGASIGTD